MTQEEIRLTKNCPECGGEVTLRQEMLTFPGPIKTVIVCKNCGWKHEYADVGSVIVGDAEFEIDAEAIEKRLIQHGQRGEEIQMKAEKPLTGYEAAGALVMEKMESLYGFMNESILVRIGVKDSVDKEYRYSTELLINDGPDWQTPKYIWENDWWEGQDEIEVVWAVPVSEFENAPNERFRM